MLAAQLLNSSFPTIHLYDRVSMALQLMEEYDIQHLPVVNEEKYIGIIGKSDLLDVAETNTIATTQEFILPVSVKGEEHFLVALKLMAEKELSLLAVVNEQTELIGIIAITDLLQQLSRFLGTEEKGGLIVLEIARRNFSFGEICRLVETNDALITQCNTMTESNTGLIIVTLKLNKIEISAIVATFQRYDYTVRYYFGQESYDNELKDNYQHLLTYLNV
ncbi:MAG: CBS domain-containing protein [Bacteroidetes bacterium]|jgi:acetoin utilization protein AcuB|nr:CBS domain-containing protein [Bacteroidota bacterium]